jgi:hypothetical protein
MRITDFESTHKVGVSCPQGGREFWLGKRYGRKRQFRSNACRQAHFRKVEFSRRYKRPDPLRNVENTPAQSTACKAQIRGRAFPVDLLGHGFKWPGSGLDPELRRKIINAEFGNRLKEVGRAKIPF